MFKTSITYKDFNDDEQTDELYFHLSKAELAMMSWTKDGRFDNVIKYIIECKDYTEMTKLFQEVIDVSYGTKAANGKFYKSPEILAEFKATAGYSELFMQLATDDVKAAAFLEQLMPADLLAKVKAQEKANQTPAPPSPAPGMSEASRIAEGKTIPPAVPFTPTT